MTNKSAAWLAGVAIALSAAGTAMADPVDWVIPTTAFDQTGTVSGSFTYDADTNTYSNINIEVTAGGPRGAASYNRVQTTGSFTPSPTLLSVRTSAAGASTPILTFFHQTPLSNAGGTAPSSAYEGDCDDTCNGYNNNRQAFSFTISGTANAPAPVPTLSEWAMILFGTLLAGGAALYIQRRRLAA